MEVEMWRWIEVGVLVFVLQIACGDGKAGGDGAIASLVVDATGELCATEIDFLTIGDHLDASFHEKAPSVERLQQVQKSHQIAVALGQKCCAAGGGHFVGFSESTLRQGQSRSRDLDYLPVCVFR